MHDLETIDRLNEESALAHELRKHVAAGGHAVSTHTGLHLTGWQPFDSADAARAHVEQHAGDVGVTHTIHYPKV